MNSQHHYDLRPHRAGASLPILDRYSAMRLLLLVIAAALCTVNAVSLQGPKGDELEPQTRFTSILSEARKQLMDSASAIASSVESAEHQHQQLQEHSAQRTPPQQPRGVAVASAAATKLLPSALAQLESSLEHLHRVQDDVSTSSIDESIKAQVLWNIDKMISDSQRLRDTSLAPYAREAVVKALRLRFGVLLTPSFWHEAVDRKLLETEA